MVFVGRLEPVLRAECCAANSSPYNVRMQNCKKPSLKAISVNFSFDVPATPLVVCPDGSKMQFQAEPMDVATAKRNHDTSFTTCESRKGGWWQSGGIQPIV